MTKNELLSVKQGDRVVYSINGHEYNATALAGVHFGYNKAIQRHSAFLSLIYLNEQGTPVKIFAAPLLGTEGDDQHLVDSADAAVRQDPNYYTSNDGDKKDMYDYHYALLKENPVTIGWRVGTVGDRPAPVLDMKHQRDLSANAALRQPQEFEFPNSDSATGNVDGGLLHGNIGHDQPIRPFTETGDGTVYPSPDLSPTQIAKSVVLHDEAAREEMRPVGREMFTKSSGDGQTEEGAWTERGDGTMYPNDPAKLADVEAARKASLPTQEEADAVWDGKVEASARPDLAPKPALPSSQYPAVVSEPETAAAIPGVETPAEQVDALPLD